MTYPKTEKCQASGVPIIRRRALLNLAPGLCSATLCLPFSPPAHASSSDALSKNRKHLPVQHAGVRMPRAKLPGGLEVSKIIKGCWQLDGAHRGDRSSDRTSGAEAVADFERFLGSGVTTIDTADIYGPSEMLVGQFLRLNAQLRAKVQVLTKLTITEEDQGRISKDMVEYRVQAAMRKMGVDHLDLIQLHWEDLSTRGYVDTARWLADLQADGLVSHVGLTNFGTEQMIEVLDAGVRIVSNQVQYSVIDRRPELFMTELCRKKDIAILPYGVLAGGFLSKSYVDKPAASAALDTMSKSKYGTQVREQGGWAFIQDVLQVLKEIAEKHNTSVSAVSIGWVLCQPCVPAAIIGARNARHIMDLQSAVSPDLVLDEEDFLAIDAAYEGSKKLPEHDCFVWERGGPW